MNTSNVISKLFRFVLKLKRIWKSSILTLVLIKFAMINLKRNAKSLNLLRSISYTNNRRQSRSIYDCSQTQNTSDMTNNSSATK
jgi:hypothetical protein